MNIIITKTQILTWTKFLYIKHYIIWRCLFGPPMTTSLVTSGIYHYFIYYRLKIYLNKINSFFLVNNSSTTILHKNYNKYDNLSIFYHTMYNFLPLCKLFIVHIIKKFWPITEKLNKCIFYDFFYTLLSVIGTV